MVEVSTLSRSILRDLCTNSRITITELSEKYKISRHSVADRIAALEKTLGLHFMLQFNYEKLGLGALHVLNVKFTKKPRPQDIRKIFLTSKVAQLVATTKGDFDLIVFALAENSAKYFEFEVALSLHLSKYGAKIRASQAVLPHLGFIPVNNETIMGTDLDAETKSILAALNRNSRMSIRELAKEIGYKEDITRYQLNRIASEKLVDAFTTIITNPPLKNNVVFFANYTLKEGIDKRVERERRTMYLKPELEMPVESEFQMMLSCTGADNSFVWASYADLSEGLRNSVEAHRTAYKEDLPVIHHAIIDEVIKGEVPLRNVDVKTAYLQNAYVTSSVP
jgi:DNA-binding Lrp family transcriptional regulator